MSSAPHEILGSSLLRYPDSVCMPAALSPLEAATDGVLVSQRWLEEHLRDPKVRVVEVDVSPEAYNQWHIDGAVLWNIYRDLKSPDYRPVDPTVVEALFTRSGIAPDSTVVFYGYAPALGLWLMNLYGHRNARILNCSRNAWLAEGAPRSATVRSTPVTRYSLPAEDQILRADRRKVEIAIGDPDITIVDVRSDPEYRGDCFWPSGGSEPGGRAGHIPGALHLSFEGLHDNLGSYRSVQDLKKFLAALDAINDSKMILYCTIGGRAATAWFVLTHLLGRPGVSVYDGSWAEWGRTPTSPVVCGPSEPKQTPS